MFWCGVTSIAHLAAIALERWYTMTHIQWSVANKYKVSKRVYLIIFFCWLFGFCWAISPVAGMFSVYLKHLTLIVLSLIRVLSDSLSVGVLRYCFDFVFQCKR